MNTLQRLTHRGRTAARILRAFVLVRRMVGRRELPDLVHALADGARPHRAAQHPRTLGRAVAAVLRIGPLQARCLITSLVLYRLLREDGYTPELVIGMPEVPDSPMAHAWVEIRGIDVGPPPGKGAHLELLRFS
ncbi:MAG TPA: lasso peptide biosynthesis B2 protein [Longimicrobiales bacterium]|nr:lasso peptide biosynthesis B2 protein [Longimicrobiales bacterium]